MDFARLVLWTAFTAAVIGGLFAIRVAEMIAKYMCNAAPGLSA